MIIHRLTKLGEGSFGKAYLVRLTCKQQDVSGSDDKLSDEEYRVSKPESWERLDRFDGKETVSADTFTAVVKLARNADRAEETINTEYYAYRRLASWRDKLTPNPYYDFVVVSPRNRSMLLLPYAGASIGSCFTTEKRMDRRFSMEDISHISKDLTRCLTAIHRCHLLHRDVSVNNVMIVEKGGIKRAILLDFGLAIDSSTSKKVSSKNVGTLSFRSIDTMRGTKPYCEKDDFESALWVLLFLFLDGMLPWKSSDSVEDVMDKKTRALQLLENCFLSSDDSMKCDYSSDSLDSYESIASAAVCPVCSESSIKCSCEDFVKIPGIGAILEMVLQKKTRIKDVTADKTMSVDSALDTVKYCQIELWDYLEEHIDEMAESLVS